MFKRITAEFNAEIDAENKMLIQVLEAAGITYKTDEWFDRKSEFRTWLISQLKYVPFIIGELRRENGDLKRKLEYANKERYRDSVIIRRLARKLADNGIEYEDVIKDDFHK